MTDNIEVPTDDSEVMEKAFEFYCEKCLHPMAPPAQRKEIEMAFYAGAIQMFDILLIEGLSDADKEAMLHAVRKELMMFAVTTELWATGAVKH